MITECFVRSIFFGDMECNFKIFFDPSMCEAGGKTEFFSNLKEPRGNLELLLCTKYDDYWMFHWLYINGDMQYIILGHF